MSYVYLLLSTDGCTYVGATVNLDRRLRQHNKEISGGAIATTSKVLRGETWKRVCHISGFPTWQAALQFEWRWKQISRKMSTPCNPLKRRMIALKKLLELKQSTSKAMPYSEWITLPLTIIEDDDVQIIYNEFFNLEPISTSIHKM